MEIFCLTEVDVDGRVVALVLFDFDDRSAALADAHARFAAGEAARFAGQAAIVAHWEASIAHDAEGVRQ